MKLPPIFVLFLALLALGFVGCESTDHPTAPGGSTLSITASETKIGLSGSAQIQVTGFRPDGNPLPEGTQIRFSASLGTIEPAVAAMNADGVARATFRADGRTGTASITASLNTGGSGGGGGGGGDGGGAGAGTGTDSASVSIEVSELKPTLLINANPSTIDVLETSLVTVTARDENSLPLGAGEEILLTADLGDLAKDGQTVDSVLTGEDGRATVTFIAGPDPGNGSVTAILANSDEVTASINITDAPADFFFNISPTSVPVGGGTVDLTVTVVNANSDPVGQVTVGFESEKGSLDPASSLTNNQGVATSVLTVADTEIDENTGSFEVSATVVIRDEPVTKTRLVEVR